MATNPRRQQTLSHLTFAEVNPDNSNSDSNAGCTEGEKRDRHHPAPDPPSEEEPRAGGQQFLKTAGPPLKLRKLLHDQRELEREHLKSLEDATVALASITDLVRTENSRQMSQLGRAWEWTCRHYDLADYPPESSVDAYREIQVDLLSLWCGVFKGAHELTRGFEVLLQVDDESFWRRVAQGDRYLLAERKLSGAALQLLNELWETMWLLATWRSGNPAFELLTLQTSSDIQARLGALCALVTGEGEFRYPIAPQRNRAIKRPFVSRISAVSRSSGYSHDDIVMLVTAWNLMRHLRDLHPDSPAKMIDTLKNELNTSVPATFEAEYQKSLGVLSETDLRKESRGWLSLETTKFSNRDGGTELLLGDTISDNPVDPAPPVYQLTPEEAKSVLAELLGGLPSDRRELLWASLQHGQLEAWASKHHKRGNTARQKKKRLAEKLRPELERLVREVLTSSSSVPRPEIPGTFAEARKHIECNNCHRPALVLGELKYWEVVAPELARSAPFGLHQESVHALYQAELRSHRSMSHCDVPLQLSCPICNRKVKSYKTLKGEKHRPCMSCNMRPCGTGANPHVAAHRTWCPTLKHQHHWRSTATPSVLLCECGDMISTALIPAPPGNRPHAGPPTHPDWAWRPTETPFEIQRKRVGRSPDDPGELRISPQGLLL